MESSDLLHTSDLLCVLCASVVNLFVCCMLIRSCRCGSGDRGCASGDFGLQCGEDSLLFESEFLHDRGVGDGDFQLRRDARGRVR